jgi:hypothetical protein
MVVYSRITLCDIDTCPPLDVYRNSERPVDIGQIWKAAVGDPVAVEVSSYDHLCRYSTDGCHGDRDGMAGEDRVCTRGTPSRNPLSHKLDDMAS